MTVFEYNELDCATEPPNGEPCPAFGLTVHPMGWMIFQEINPIFLYSWRFQNVRPNNLPTLLLVYWEVLTHPLPRVPNWHLSTQMPYDFHTTSDITIIVPSS